MSDNYYIGFVIVVSFVGFLLGFWLTWRDGD